jgi:hypothetical protein
MYSRRGNAAMRRVVVRAARALRRGAGRHRTLIGVRRDQAEVSLRFPEADDSDVADALADQIGRWLTAAGFHGIDGLDDVSS